MRFGDVLHPGDIRHLPRAFIMHHHIEATGPIRLFVNAELVLLCISVSFVNDRPGDIGAGTDAFGEDFLLGLVIMAATAGDKQSAQRLGRAQTVNGQ